MDVKSSIILICTMVLALEISGEKLIELNHDFHEKTPFWPNPKARPFLHSPISNGFNDQGLWYASFNYEGTEHSGTHMDAPSHFQQKGWTVDKIPIDRFFAPAAVIDIREKVKKNSLATLSVDDVVKWVDKHGPLPNNSVILVLTGWESKYSDPQSYFGIKGDTKTFPGIGLDGAQALLQYRAVSDIYIVGVGIDGPSLDTGANKKAEVHRELFAANIYGLENLKNIDKLPVTGAELVVMPMKIKGGSGAPCRVIARIQENGANGVVLSSVNIIVISLAFLLKYI